MLVHFNWYTKKKASLALNTVIFVFVFSYLFLLFQVAKPNPQLAAAKAKIPSTPSILYSIVENAISQGDTIVSILKKAGIDHQTAFKLFTETRPIYDLKQICKGRKYALFFSPEKNEFLKFRYEIDPSRTLIVSKDEQKNTFKAKIDVIPYKVEEEYVSGEIQESLFASILASGEKPELADLLASLYDYDIDFNRDIRKNDSYELIVEKKYLDGQFVKYGNILAAEFTNRGKAVQVIRFVDAEGKASFYHPDGRSVRKMFLRCPLPFMKVTSSYGNRVHPLLGYSAKHNGIDLHAPAGTPIRSTASGVIRAAGRDGSRGNYIIIEHPNHYSTHYYHLSKFGEGIKSGKRVDQSQIIGYVGSTGWSTGPHLHYGLMKDSKFSNPLNLNCPNAEPIKEIYREIFKTYAYRISLLMTTSKIAKLPSFFIETVLVNDFSKIPNTPDKGQLAR